MAIAIRGTTPAIAHGAADPQSVTLTGTRQPQAGDLLVIIHANDFYALSNMPTPTVGGSTTGVTSIVDSDSGTNDAHTKCWWFAVTSTGDLTVAVDETGTADEDKALIVYVLSGADTASPIDGSGQQVDTGSTTHICPSVSPVSSDAFLICHTNTGTGAAAASYTQPSGMTETYDLLVASGGMSVGGAVLQLSASGATGTKTFTPNTGIPNNANVSIAVKTAGGAPAVATPGPVSAYKAAVDRASRLFHRPVPIIVGRSPLGGAVDTRITPRPVVAGQANQTSRRLRSQPFARAVYRAPAVPDISTVSWVPGEFSIESGTPAATPGPVTVSWPGADLSVEAPAWAATPIPVVIAWVPGEATIEAGVPALAPQPVTVSWTAAEWTLSAPGWAATPGPVTVAWTPAQATIEAPAWAATPLPVTVSWPGGSLTVELGDISPIVLGSVVWPGAEFTIEAGGLAARATVAWTAAQLTVDAPVWPVAAQPVTVAWPGGDLVLEHGPPPVLTPGPASMVWTPAEATIEAAEWPLSTVALPRWTILRAVDVYRLLVGTGPEPQLIAYGQGGLVEHTLKVGDVRTLRYDLRRDLTGVSTVTFRIVNDVGGPLIVNRVGTIIDVAGIVDLAILAGDYGSGKLELNDRYPRRRPFLLEALTGPVPVTHPNRGQEILWLEPAVA